MKKRRSKVPLKVELTPDKPMEKVEDLLDLIFWKAPSLTDEAIEFLRHVKEWGRTDSPYKAEDWNNYCSRTGMSQGKYHNMLRRLKKAGMIEKTYNESIKEHEIRISDKFSFYLSRMGRLWDGFCSR